MEKQERVVRINCLTRWEKTVVPPDVSQINSAPIGRRAVHSKSCLCYSGHVFLFKKGPSDFFRQKHAKCRGRVCKKMSSNRSLTDAFFLLQQMLLQGRGILLLENMSC